MYFRYDGDTPIGFEYNGDEYYYVTNLQGDIIAVLNDSGECVAEYTYDAWGNCTITRDTEYIASVNPLRYRGYYYDSDTGLYYLQSRYYDPNIGRFINADDSEMLFEDQDTMVQYNLFAYCGNSPVINIDPTGYGKTYVFYYLAGRGTLDHFARKSAYFSFSSSKVVRFPVYSAQQFVNSWNNLGSDIDSIYLYLHGDPGQLNFQTDRNKSDILSFNKGGKYNEHFSLYNLKKVKVKNKIVLLSCYGAKKNKEGKSVAEFLHERNHCTVVACTGGVNYRDMNSNKKKYYASASANPKKYGKWVNFYYQKRFIKFGKVVSKRTFGFNGVLYL